MAMGITIRWYNEEMVVVAAPIGARKVTIFLCGPTTDGRSNGIAQAAGISFSIWRAYFIGKMLGIASSIMEEVELVIVVPEFRNKFVNAPGGEEQSAFQQNAKATFGNTTVPAGIPSKAVSWGVLQWERSEMHRADYVVIWCDFRDQQPGLGLNARPEIAEEITVLRFTGLVKEKLILAIGPECTGATRFWAQVYDAGISPDTIGRSWESLVTALVAKLSQ